MLKDNSNYITEENTMFLDKAIPKNEKNKENVYSFLSHAHSDHCFSIKKNNTKTSKQTHHILSDIPFNMKKIKNVNLYEAGHILGSKQITIEGDGELFCYTGDIKLEDNIFSKGAKIISCDRLLIESTYACLDIKLPKKEQVYNEICHFLEKELKNKIILFGAYSLGKSQELIKLLNKIGITPIVEEKIEKNCKKYCELGFDLNRICIDTKEAKEILKTGEFVGILGPRKVNKTTKQMLEIAYKKQVITCIVSGWAAKYKLSCDRSFALSDHASLDELLEYVLLSGAKEIHTFHGYSKNFAKILCNLGLNAKEYKK